MNLTNAISLVLFPLGISLGQILFKISSVTIRKPFGVSSVIDLMFNGYFVGAIFLYGAMTFMWVWILTRLPLAVAYPFNALVFVFVPIFAFWFVGEHLRWPTLAGAAIICVGVCISALF